MKHNDFVPKVMVLVGGITILYQKLWFWLEVRQA